MLKAMLNSPTADSSGTATLFNASELAALRRDKSLIAQAVEANDIMVAAETFLTAYARIDCMTKAKLLSSLQVRAVMRLFNKKVETRASFSSLLHVADAFYTEAKKVDPLLPVWDKIASLQGTAASSSSTQPVMGGLREINMHCISDETLVAKGFAVGALIQDIKGGIYKITELCKDMKSVSLKPEKIAFGTHMLLVEKSGKKDKKDKTDKKDKKDKNDKKGNNNDTVEILKLCRVDLVSAGYKVYTPVQVKILDDYPDPTVNFDFRASVLQGVVKDRMLAEFEKSAEQHVQLQVAPETTMTFMKNFKAGSFRIVALSNSVVVSKSIDPDSTGYHIMGTFKDEYKIACRNSNVLPKSGVQAHRVFVSKFFLATESFDMSRANCKYDVAKVTVNIGKETFHVQIPSITNSKDVSKGDQLVVLPKRSNVDAAEPCKRPRTTARK